MIYKLMDTGTYELVFSADGYDSVTVSNVATAWGTPAVVDVQMAMTGAVAPLPLPAHPTLTAWPNPFNPGTRLTVTVPVAGPVSLGVFDLRGRLVRSLLKVEAATGPLPVVWDGRDERGTMMPSGVYFGRAHSVSGSATVKLMLLK